MQSLVSKQEFNSESLNQSILGKAQKNVGENNGELETSNLIYAEVGSNCYSTTMQSNPAYSSILTLAKSQCQLQGQWSKAQVVA